MRTSGGNVEDLGLDDDALGEYADGKGRRSDRAGGVLGTDKAEGNSRGCEWGTHILTSFSHSIISNWEACSLTRDDGPSLPEQSAAQKNPVWTESTAG